MKLLEQFMGIFKAPETMPVRGRMAPYESSDVALGAETAKPRGKAPPPTPRGRVDPYQGQLVGSGASAPKAKVKAHSDLVRKGGVYRAASGAWEEFADAQVKEGPPVDDEAQGT